MVMLEKKFEHQRIERNSKMLEWLWLDIMKKTNANVSSVSSSRPVEFALISYLL